jgi:hypothetical protein
MTNERPRFFRADDGPRPRGLTAHGSRIRPPRPETPCTPVVRLVQLVPCNGMTPVRPSVVAHCLS